MSAPVSVGMIDCLLGREPGDDRRRCSDQWTLVSFILGSSENTWNWPELVSAQAVPSRRPPRPPKGLMELAPGGSIRWYGCRRAPGVRPSCSVVVGRSRVGSIAAVSGSASAARGVAAAGRLSPSRRAVWVGGRLDFQVDRMHCNGRLMGVQVARWSAAWGSPNDKSGVAGERFGVTGASIAPQRSCVTIITSVRSSAGGSLVISMSITPNP